MVTMAVRSRGSFKIRRLGARVMIFVKSKMKYISYFVPPKPQNDIFDVQINIFNSCIYTVIYEPFKYSGHGS